jgi:hypothetical protein
MAAEKVRYRFGYSRSNCRLLAGIGLDKGDSTPVGDQNPLEHPQAIPSQLE